MSERSRLDRLRLAEQAARERSSASAQDSEQRLERARHYRERAEEQRALAEDSILPETQQILLGLADSYEHMATMLEDMPDGP